MCGKTGLLGTECGRGEALRGGVGRVKLLAMGSFLKGGLAGWYRAAWLELCAKKFPCLVVSINHPTTGGL